MAELAVTDGLPRGECITTWLYDDVGKLAGLRVDRADPRILVSAELLTKAFTAPMASVSVNTDLLREDRNGTPFWEGAVLTICGVNRTVIYRITGYVPRVHAYIAEWAD